ncbi:MAG: tetratricopeptide repeat protein, partial [Bacteroidota bacterium]
MNFFSNILLLFLSCFAFNVCAQIDIEQKEHQIDSLKGNQKYRLMLEVAEVYADSIPKKSLYYMQVLIKEIGKPSKRQSKDHIIFLADAYYNMGNSYLSLSNNKEAEQAFLNSFNISHKFSYTYGKDRAEKTLNDLGVNTGTWWERQLNNLGNLQINEKIKDATSDIQISAKSFTENIKENRIEKLDANAEEAHTNKNYYTAINHYSKALEISKALYDKENVVMHHLLLAELYKEIENTPDAIQQYDSAIFVINTWEGIPNNKVFTDSIMALKKRLAKGLKPPVLKKNEIAKPLIVQKKQQDSTIISLDDKIYISTENIAEEKKKLAILDDGIKESLQKGDYEKALEYKELYFLSQLKLTRDSAQIIELQAKKDEQEYQISVQKTLIEQEQNAKIQERNAKIFL